MAQRWSDLDVQGFSSLLPVRDYLKRAVGAARAGRRGRHGATPSSPISASTRRDQGVDGGGHVQPRRLRHQDLCRAAAHRGGRRAARRGHVAADRDAAVRRGDRVWTDAVWVKDANVTEALRRGADEVWLVWCIGNSDHWGDGPLEQYVHMIEMSANGALFAELDAARAAGRRSGCTSCARSTRCRWTPSSSPAGSAPTPDGMGYRDAMAYLETMAPDGVRGRPDVHGDDRAAGRGVRLPRRCVASLRPRDDDRRHRRADPAARGRSWTGAAGRPRRPRALGRPACCWPADGWSAPARTWSTGRGHGSTGDGSTSRRAGELTDDAGLDAWADMTTVARRGGQRRVQAAAPRPADAARALASASRWVRTAAATPPRCAPTWAGPDSAGCSRRTAHRGRGTR